MLKKLQVLLSAALILVFLIPSGAAKAAIYLPPTFTKVAAGSYSIVALASDGRVWTWGDLMNQSPGYAGGAQQTLPTLAAGLSSVTDISAMNTHALALDANHQVWAWGYNGDGSLGDGTYATSLSPNKIATLPPIAKIAAGGHHSLAVTITGAVYAWGADDHGQVTGSVTSGSVTPVQVSLPAGVAILDVAAGEYFSLALSSTGVVYAWGDNQFNQIADGSLTTPISGLGNVQQIAAAQYHALATVAGAVYSWGFNGGGQLGIGNNNANNTVNLVMASGASNIIAGGYNSFVVKTNKSLLAWGDNSSGQLGLYSGGSPDMIDKLSPTPISSAGSVLSVASGAGHTAVVVSNGSIKVTGAGMNGQTGTVVPFNATGFFTSPSFASATLSSLQFYIPSQGTWTPYNAGISFQPGTSTYSISVPGNAWALGMDAPSADGSRTINNQPPVNAGSFGVNEVPLNVGNNVVTLEVKSSADPSLISTYTINVNRAADTTPPSFVDSHLGNQPDSIVLQFDEPITLAPNHSTAADFTVKAGNEVIAVQNAVYDSTDQFRTKLLLQLAQNVPYSQTVTLNIAANAVQDDHGNGNPQVAGITINNAYPSIESAFASPDGSKIYIRYDRPLWAVLYPNLYDISVYPNHDTSHARNVQSIDFADSTTVVLNMIDNVADANVLELYISAGFVKDEANVSSQGVTNVPVATSAAAIAAKSQVDANHDGVSIDEVVKAIGQHMDINQDGKFDRNDGFALLTFIAARTVSIPAANN